MGYILFTPVPPEGVKDLELGFVSLRHIVTLLRSYNMPVYLLGPVGTRGDYASFLENDNKSDLDDIAKLELIRSADLIVGVPNTYQWAATSIQKRIITLYPDNVDSRKYFDFQSANFARIVWESSGVVIPSMLAGLRTLIKLLSTNEEVTR